MTKELTDTMNSIKRQQKQFQIPSCQFQIVRVPILFISVFHFCLTTNECIQLWIENKEEGKTKTSHSLIKKNNFRFKLNLKKYLKFLCTKTISAKNKFYGFSLLFEQKIHKIFETKPERLQKYSSMWWCPSIY